MPVFASIKPFFNSRNGVETIVKRAAHAASCKFGTELALLDPVKGFYFKLNPAATLIWEALEKGSTKNALAASLIEKWGVAEQQAFEDVSSFLENLKELSLLEDVAS